MLIIRESMRGGKAEIAVSSIALTYLRLFL